MLRIPRSNDLPTRRCRRGVHSLLAAGIVAACLGAGVAPARAGWPSQPNVNLAMCTAPGAQSFRHAVSDGAGGLIVAWVDTRSDSADLYAQRVSANGALVWEWNGVLVCGAAGDQDQPAIASDGAGGCVVVWRDFRGGPVGDIWAQRLGTDGQPRWAAGGIPVCTAGGDQSNPFAIADGFGGTLVAWEDGRSGFAVYAQRLDAQGAPRWAAGGVRLTPAVAVTQFDPQVAPDGEGGAIVGWTQSTGAGLDVAMQRVSNLGALLWGNSGLAPCGSTGDQLHLRLAADGALGAVIAWEDYRTATGRVRAQRIGPWTTLMWGPDGIEAGPAAGDQLDPAVVGDGAGGVVVTWADLRGATSDVWAQRVLANGTRAWGAAGLAVCAASGEQLFPALAADGTGGALVTWEDTRVSAASDLWVQRVSGNGTARWAAGGVPMCSAPGSQYQPVIVSDGDSVAVAVWVDQRTGGSDLFAQRVPAVITLDTPPPAAGALALVVSPNPARRACTVRATLPSRARVRVELLDPAGRRVRLLADEAGAAGVHAWAWDGRDDAGRGTSPGVYFARLTADGAVRTARVLRLER